VALALLFEVYGLDEVLTMENPAVGAFTPAEIRLLHQAWRKGLGAPISTSMGRLFDAVASLSGLCQRVGYEGESGMLLESAAGAKRKREAEGLLRIVEGEEGFVVDWEPLVRKLARGAEEPAAAAFHEALAEVVREVAKRYPDLPLVLTGGVFQNRTLCEAVLPKLSERRVLLPRHTPVNDGAVALGQLWYALHR
jgi:hydrogenase maturation protein HypF